jgi:hypothetical protein
MVDRSTGRVFELLDMVAKARLKLGPQSQSPVAALNVTDKDLECVPTENPIVIKSNNKTIRKEFSKMPKISTPTIPKDSIGSSDNGSLRTDSFAVAMKKASSSNRDTNSRLVINTSKLHEDEEDDDEEEDDRNYENALDAECERLRVLLEEKFMMAESLRDN